MKLSEDDGTTLHDGERTLPTFIYTAKGAPSVMDYLNKGTTGANQKESFKISAKLCSTMLTQNIGLLALFQWRANVQDLEVWALTMCYVCIQGRWLEEKRKWLS